MYLEHFGMNELPFGLTPDTSFLFETTGHRDTVDTVLLALKNGEGFIMVHGEVGTGKTLACRQLLQQLGPNYRSIYVPNPSQSRRSLMQALCHELQIPVKPTMSETQLQFELNKALFEFALQDITVVAFLDEAQAMPDDTLEMLRLVSNLETEKSKLLRVVLFGQPELPAKLSKPSMRQLMQRISFHHQVEGLRPEETSDYLMHRLRAAGYRGPALFSAKDAVMLHEAAFGVPRVLNTLAHKSLLIAYGRGADRVLTKHIRAAVRDTPSANQKMARPLILNRISGFADALIPRWA